jgi:hypothetical protein
MKFLKKSQLNFRNVKDQSVAVGFDGNEDGTASTVTGPRARIVMENTNSLQLPSGVTSERPDPAILVDGMIRYNQTTNELEARQNSAWRKISFKEPRIITQQSLGNGDAAEIYFGPLDSGNTDYPYPELTKPQNIIVLIENVFQLATTNYTLADNPVSTISVAKTDGSPTLITSEATDSMIGATVSGTGISGTVTGVTPGVSLTLDANASGAGTVSVTVTRDGRFVEFTSAVPYGKPVTVLHGFDGATNV